MVPLLGRTVVRLTSDQRNFAIMLVNKTKELKREKRKADSLLHQMLPSNVVKQLKQGEGVPGEYFKQVKYM